VLKEITPKDKIMQLLTLQNANQLIGRTVTTLTQEQAIAKLKDGFKSFVRNIDLAEVISVQSGIDIPVNRKDHDLDGAIIAAIITTPRPLFKGENWTEQELLNMNIKWVYAQ
jgi:hypothetical protein